VLLATVYLAPSVLITLILTPALPFISWEIFKQGRQVTAALFFLFFVPVFVGFSVTSIRHIAALLHLRGLAAAAVLRVELVDDGSDASRLIDDPRAVKEIVGAAQRLFPFSPNHESFRSPWTLNIVSRQETLSLRIGDGTSAYPSTVRVAFPAYPAYDYHCPRLASVLARQGALPWPRAENPSRASD
jgi:hypothetical protein